MKKIIALSFLAFVLIIPTHATIVVQNFWHTGEDGQLVPTDSIGSKPFTAGFGTREVDSTIVAPQSTASLHFIGGTGGDYMDVLSDAISVPSDNWVIEFWANPTTTSGGVTVLTLGSDSSTSQVGLVNGNWFFGEMNVTYGNSSVTAAPGVWTHLAWVRDNGSNRFFVDGVEIQGNADGVVNNGRLHLGVKPGGGESYDGFLDEIRFSTFASGQFSTADLLINVVPEPTGGMMLICAGGALFGLMRRPFGRNAVFAGA